MLFYFKASLIAALMEAGKPTIRILFIASRSSTPQGHCSINVKRIPTTSSENR
jgi:hypothetical protein